MANKKYDSNKIQVLEGLDPVRKRPGMYIGSTGTKGLHQLVWEIIDNSIDEHMEGECSQITVYLNSDGSVSVEDDGRGIPIDLHENTKDYPVEMYPNGICTERIILTVLHSGGKFDNESYAFSGGLHGVGISVVNALSKYLKVEIFRDKQIYVDEYKNGGNPITKLNKGQLNSIGKTNKRGTKITFVPDETIFETTIFKPEVIHNRLHELSFLNKGLRIVLIDNTKDSQKETVFYHEEGIVGFIKEINKNKDTVFNDIVYVSGRSELGIVEFAMQNLNDFSENIISFCNNINTSDGGTHVTGAKLALTKVINKFAKQLNNKGKTLDGRDIRSGLSCILSIKIKEPQFEGQTKSKLGSTHAKSLVDEILSSELELFFDKNLDLVKQIIDQAQKFEKARMSESKNRESFLKKQSSSIGNSKLASCQKHNDPSKGILTEIFIVEGDSAGGSAKTGRDRSFQAILPLWGKMLNVEKSNPNEIYTNDKLAPVVLSLGTGIGEDFNINKLKYDKIIVMADADVDGSHIQTLLLTFFFRYMRELIEHGHIYLATPPLYKIVQPKKTLYLYSDIEFQKLMASGKNVGTVSRFKGLGEMNPEQLWETTMNPATRVLQRVELSDIIEAEQTTTILMGSKVPPRKAFIEENAIKANISI